MSGDEVLPWEFSCDGFGEFTGAKVYVGSSGEMKGLARRGSVRGADLCVSERLERLERQAGQQANGLQGVPDLPLFGVIDIHARRAHPR